MRNLAKLLIMFVLVIGIVGAVAPITTIYSGETGIEMEVAAPIAVPTSTEINVTLHLFNSSDGKLLNNMGTYSCEGHLFNPYGIMIADQQAGIYGHSFYFTMNKTMATTPGIYIYSIHCNSSSIGGFLTSFFDVTESGLSLNVEDSIGNVGVIFFLFSLGIFFLIFAKNTEQPGIKLFFNLLGYIVIILSIGSCYILLQGLQSNLIPIAKTALIIVSIVFIVIMYYVFINLTKQALALMRAKKGFGSDFDDPAVF